MRVLRCFCHPAGCVAPFFSYHDGTTERPKQRPVVDNTVNQQRSCNHSSKIAQGSRATALSINLPTTLIHWAGPFCVPQYNPPPLAPWPASPSGKNFDFTEVDMIPLSVPPAAGNLLSSVKHAHAVGGNQNNLQKKVIWKFGGESDEDIICMWQ